MKSLFLEAQREQMNPTADLSPFKSFFSQDAQHLNNQSYDTLMVEDQPEQHSLHPFPRNISQEDVVPVLSQELKKLRLRISDYTKSQVVDSVCQKIWRLMITTQYEETLLSLVPHYSVLPINIHLYSVITPMFERALGIYYHTNYYVARRETYKERDGNVFY